MTFALRTNIVDEARFSANEDALAKMNWVSHARTLDGYTAAPRLVVTRRANVKGFAFAALGVATTAATAACALAFHLIG